MVVSFFNNILIVNIASVNNLQNGDSASVGRVRLKISGEKKKKKRKREKKKKKKKRKKQKTHLRNKQRAMFPEVDVTC